MIRYVAIRYFSNVGIVPSVSSQVVTSVVRRESIRRDLLVLSQVVTLVSMQVFIPVPLVVFC